jgi:hypothetical protein
MASKAEGLQKKLSLFLAIGAYVFYVGFCICFYGLKFGVKTNWFGAITVFGGLTAVKGGLGIIEWVGLIAVLLASIVFYVMLAVKKDNPLKKQGIILITMFLIFAGWAVLACMKAKTVISQARVDIFTKGVAGTYGRAVKLFFVLFVAAAIIYAVLAIVSIIYCIKAKKEPEAVEEKKEEEKPAEEEKKEEEPKQEEKPVEEKPAEEVKPAEEPKKEEAAPVVAAAAETAPAEAEEAEDKKAAKRVPFEEKILHSDDTCRHNYAELKDEIALYGIKSRISVSGDTYRLHTVKYLKITVAGKKLKLYYKLDPKKYMGENSTIPVTDASSKKIYADTPCVLKVKSPLSLKRAKMLLADMMKEAGIEKKEPKAPKAPAVDAADKK